MPDLSSPNPEWQKLDDPTLRTSLMMRGCDPLEAKNLTIGRRRRSFAEKIHEVMTAPPPGDFVPKSRKGLAAKEAAASAAAGEASTPLDTSGLTEDDEEIDLSA